MSTLLSGSESCTYSVNKTTRCIVPVFQEEAETHGFIVGTSCVRGGNEVHILEYDEESAESECKKKLEHAGEIWSMSTSPLSPNFFFTCYNEGLGGEGKASLWDSSSETLENVTDIPQIESKGPVKKVLWDPTAEEGETDCKIVSIHSAGVAVWQLDDLASIERKQRKKSLQRCCLGLIPSS